METRMENGMPKQKRENLLKFLFIIKMVIGLK